MSQKIRFASALAVGAWLVSGGFAMAADEAREAPEAFLQKYYTALHGAKHVWDMDKYCTPMPEAEKQKQLQLLKEGPPGIEEFMVQMLQQEPDKVKVVSKREEGDKAYLELAPETIPKDFLEASKSPNFSMKGEAILVKDGNSWLVYKDFWTVLTKDKDGSSKTTFGRNPEKDKDKDKTAE